jgi:protein-S-isoprenylcysteine O-methyltransferase Ste14
MDLRQRIFELRSYTPIPFLIVMVFLAHPTLVSYVIGLVIVLSGESIRLWGVAFAGSETRTTGPVGGTYLITRGPFAYVRNPLYLGNMMIYTGVGIMANVWWLAVIAFFYFMWQYTMIVGLEEEYLLKTFGRQFEEYCRAVPRFLPSARAYGGSGHEQPDLDWKSGIASERRTLQAIALLTVVMAVLWIFRG